CGRRDGLPGTQRTSGGGTRGDRGAGAVSRSHCRAASRAGTSGIRTATAGCRCPDERRTAGRMAPAGRGGEPRGRHHRRIRRGLRSHRRTHRNSVPIPEVSVRRFVDDLGTEVALEGTPCRVVSLVPSLTETVEVSSRGRLAGITDYCTHPVGLGLPTVG